MVASRSISRRALGGLALGGLAACRRRGHDGLVLGDQVGLMRARNEAAGVLRGVPYPIRWANFAGAAPLFEAMNAGALDTGVAGDAPFILAAAAGVPMKAIAANRSSGRGIAILVPDASPVRAVEALRGRRVIVSSARGSVSHLLLLEALERVGVAPAAVTIGFMLPADAAAAFSAGQIDAWATFGSYQATAEAAGARVLVDGRGLSPAVSLIVASDAALRDAGKREALADLLRRQVRAAEWSMAHRDAYAAIYTKRTGMPVAVARTLAGWENRLLLPLDAATVAGLQHTADRFLHFGAIPARVDVPAFVDGGPLASTAAV